MIKKVTLCLIAILGSASALAAGGNDMALPTASGVNLMAPHQEGSWSFGAQANYFQPSNDFNYAYEGQQTGTSPDVYNVNTHSVDQDSEWGWGVDVTYHFPGEGRDVTLAYTQLDTDHSDSATQGNGSGDYLYGTGPVFAGTDVEPDINDEYSNADAHVDTDYQAVDLTFGQMITIGDRISLHPFAGLRYADIDYKADASYYSLNSSDQISGNTGYQSLHSEFTGAGPRLGSDAAVNLGGGFSLHGTLGVSLLVGSQDNSASYSETSYNSGVPDTDSTDTYNHDEDSGTRVVPEADAKLSAMYNMDFNNGYGLGFEVGYQVTNYFNATMNDSGSYFDTSDQYSDFSMQGPYARIQLDVA